MSRISIRKREKIKEDILRVLYENSPMAVSTSFVADEVVRDNEFILCLLEEMKKVGFVNGLRGEVGKKKVRIKWRLSDRAFKQYQELLRKGLNK